MINPKIDSDDYVARFSGFGDFIHYCLINLLILAIGLVVLLLTIPPASAQALTEQEFNQLEQQCGNEDSVEFWRCAGYVAPGEMEPAILEWIAPTTRLDGTALPLSEVASYVLHLMFNGQTLTADITRPEATIYIWRDPPAGPQEYTIATIDTDGNVSPFVDPVPLNHTGVVVGKSRPSGPTNLRVRQPGG